MRTNPFAKNYGLLTAEERFRLILAAGGRGDEAESERLVNAGPRITLSMPDHHPWSHAFDELALLVFIELHEFAAHYLESFSRADQIDDLLDDAEGNEGEGDEAEAEKGKAGRLRYLDMALAAGFVLKTKAAGWKLFCERMSVPPFLTWEVLPGFERLRRALALADKAAFTPEGFLRWLNGSRAAGEPERTELPCTAEGLADAASELFGRRVEWWGG
jgi:hypothetical protein